MLLSSVQARISEAGALFEFLSTTKSQVYLSDVKARRGWGSLVFYSGDAKLAQITIHYNQGMEHTILNLEA